MNTESVITSIDQYIAQFPVDVQDVLQKIRSIIKQKAPDATEAISYQMPTFKLNGNLIHFAAYKNHIGLYPTPSGMVAFEEKTAMYKQGKGSIQFPLKQAIPYDLIAEIVEFRMAESIAKANSKKTKRS